MDILSDLNVLSNVHIDGNLEVKLTDTSFLNVIDGSINICVPYNMVTTTEFFLGSGYLYSDSAPKMFISGSFLNGSITRVNHDNTVADRLCNLTTLMGNQQNSTSLIIHSDFGTLIESNPGIIFKSEDFVEFNIDTITGGDVSCYSSCSLGHIDFNLYCAINENFLCLSQNNIFTIHGRGVDGSGCLNSPTFDEERSVKLMSIGYAVSEFYLLSNSYYTGNYVRFQLSGNEPTATDCINYNESQYIFSDQGIYISSNKNDPRYSSVLPGRYAVCNYDFIRINGVPLFDGVIPKQKQFTNVEIPASCQLVNFGVISMTEFKILPPMMQLSDNENNIIHANIQVEPDRFAAAYNLMVSLEEHDDVIPTGKYKLNVFGY